MINAILYFTPALIWGSTWLMIKYQLGVVDPLVSVAYRFALAGILILIYCVARGINLRFNPKEYLYILVQGLLLFGVNYWFVYVAEQYLTSGLVAIMFSTLVFLNIFYERLFLGTKIKSYMILGAVTGFSGVGLVFKPEIVSIDITKESLIGFVLALIAANLASLGNIVSMRNQRNNLPVIQTNAFGMTLGALSMIILSLVLGKPFNFSFTFSYVSSLLYLTIFGSIVAFSAYLTILGRIGAGKAAYITLIIPVIALIMSTFFEAYHWSGYSVAGVTLILMGNFLVLYKKGRRLKS